MSKSFFTTVVSKYAIYPSKRPVYDDDGVFTGFKYAGRTESQIKSGTEPTGAPMMEKTTLVAGTKAKTPKKSTATKKTIPTKKKFSWKK